ncbi:MAG TPA: PPOX class F420-dependent oxidoreductase [Steroidobacteraceae bacterium]|nr:PPOX class F420-dependent oxidoreductase [Steroidobacteraceae bacterium]HQZ81556.1 PPOX class F420-dependent oxidoreductase [Steroidobacteraceae bacterium]
MTFARTRPIPRECHDILQDRPTGHMATLRPDGRLSVTPVSPMFDGEYVRISTVKSRQKYRNLLADPRIAISIPHRNNPNRYVEIRGIAELTDDVDRSFVNSIARHYMNVDVYPFDKPGDERVTITIHAEQVSSPDIPLAAAPPGAPDRGRNNREDFA